MNQEAPQINPVDEPSLAGLAYLLGLIPALIIWKLKKDDSPSLRFHALQAAFYDGFVGIMAIGLLMLSFLALPVLMIGAWLATNIIADVVAPEAPLVYLMLTIVLLLLTSGGFGLAAVLILSLNLIDLVAAACLFAGKNWRYPILANWVEKLILRHAD
jgi:uncharacterized Tic20 family protein